MASTSLDNLATSSSTLCTESSRSRLPKAQTLDSLLGQTPQAEPRALQSTTQYLAPPVSHQEQQTLSTRLSCRQPSAGEEISTRLVYPSDATNLLRSDNLRASDYFLTNCGKEAVHCEALKAEVEHKLSTNSATPEAQDRNHLEIQRSREVDSRTMADHLDQKIKYPQAAMNSGSNSSDYSLQFELEAGKILETKSHDKEVVATHQSASKKKVRWLQIHDFCNYTLEQKYSGSLKELSVGTRELSSDCLDAETSTKQQTVSTPTPNISPNSDNTGSVFSLQENVQQSPARVSPSKGCLWEIEETRSRQSGTTSQRTPRAGILKNKTRGSAGPKEDQTSGLSQLSGSASRDNFSQVASEISEPATKPVRSRKPELVAEVPAILELGDEDSPLEKCSDPPNRSSKDVVLIGALVFFAFAILIWEACATQ